jgi:hypothetical protein
MMRSFSYNIQIPHSHRIDRLHPANAAVLSQRNDLTKHLIPFKSCMQSLTYTESSLYEIITLSFTNS